MNEVQQKYITLKAAYDTAFKKGNWALVDELEDPMLEAEFKLVDWTFEEIIKTGKMTREDTEFVRKNSNLEQWNKIVDMGMRLAV